MPTPATPAACSSLDAAAVLGVCKQKVIDLINLGCLPATRAGDWYNAPWRVDVRPESRAWRTYPETAALLAVEVSEVKRLVKAGELTVRRVAQDLALVELPGVEALLSRRTAGETARRQPTTEEVAERVAAFEPHRAHLWRYSAGRCSPVDDPDDIVQDVLEMPLLEPVLTPPMAYRDWLESRARMCLSTARRSRERVVAGIGVLLSLDAPTNYCGDGPAEEDLVHVVADTAPDPADEAVGQLVVEAVLVAARRLPPGQRELFAALAAGWGMSALAAVHGASRQTMWARVGTVRRSVARQTPAVAFA